MKNSENRKKLIVAIDGPAGSGKSTTARLAAERVGYVYIDTGAMYRAVTLAFLRSGLDLEKYKIKSLLETIQIDLKQSNAGQGTYLNGEDVSDDIRLPEVTKMVSPISAMAAVRTQMVEQQRFLGKNGGVVMDGRDIGTVVFPDADLKIYLVASIDARAERRGLELRQKGIEFSLEEVKKQLSARDNYDSSREISPLRKAEGAILLDTSTLTIEQQVDEVVGLIKGKSLNR